MDTEKFDQLIKAYQQGGLTGEQKILLDRWFDTLAESHTPASTPEQLEKLGQRILEQLERQPEKVERHRQGLPRWLPYAAMLLILPALGIAYYYLAAPERSSVTPISVLEHDVAPGGHRATLQLSSGRTIDLSPDREGIVVGSQIVYLDGTEVVQSAQTDTESQVLTTPRGGTYQITLSDGTKVWLNAASTLRYPVRFVAAERVVELDGEGYFEVSSPPDGTAWPFRVKTTQQTVEVLGTQFNVTAYSDEAETRTTLVEGAVRVINLKANEASRLRPGEQSILHASQTEIRKVNPQTVIAWKNGLFHFDDTPFSQMIKQIDRWYDIEVQYRGAVPEEVFSGKMSKNVNLGVFVDFLKDSGVRSHISGRKLIVE